MSKLKDLVDDKLQKFFAPPTFVVQDIVPADDVSKSIIEHQKYRYQLASLTPLAVGPHGGRILLIYSYTGGPVS